MRKLSRFAVNVLAVTAFVQTILALPVAAASDADLTAIVNKAKIFPSVVTVQHSGTFARFFVYKSPGAAEKDCKIDAVLVARAIMAADPKIVSVQANYLEGGIIKATIEIHAGDVKNFARGGESASELLASLQMVDAVQQPTAIAPATAATIEQYEVRPGVFRPSRIDYRNKILVLIQAKRPVKSLWTKFMAIENGLDKITIEQLQAQMKDVCDDIDKAQYEMTAAQRNEQASRTDLTARGGYKIHRRQRILVEINRRAAIGVSKTTVSALQARYADIEKYARLGDASHADAAMDLLEDDLSLPHNVQN